MWCAEPQQRERGRGIAESLLQRRLAGWRIPGTGLECVDKYHLVRVTNFRREQLGTR